MVTIENQFKKDMKLEGLEVSRGGWPDFLIKDKDGIPYFIEIKNFNDRLRDNQAHMLRMLSELGYSVFVVSKKPNNKKGRQFTLSKKHKEILEQSIIPKIKHGESLSNLIKKFERKVIIAALEDYDWNVTKTANYLNIERSLLHHKMSKHSINRPNKKH